MYFQQPLTPTDTPNIFNLAPIPVYMKVFEDDGLQDAVYDLGLEKLNETQKLMGQELPDQYDEERYSRYKINYSRTDMWVEQTEYNPIGSRFFTPPNNFLNRDEEVIRIVRNRCLDGYNTLLDGLGFEHNGKPTISESWMQYYGQGRGHNQHNHCDWGAIGAEPLSYVGGYYLSDGDPVLDHPYSGALCFHIRGMSYFIRPKKGMLLLWPYDIVHSVKPFYGNSTRCVINFNIQGFPKASKLL